MTKQSHPSPASIDRFKDRLYLVTKGVSYDLAMTMENVELNAHCIVFGKLDGCKWDADHLRWQRGTMISVAHTLDGALIAKGAGGRGVEAKSAEVTGLDDKTAWHAEYSDPEAYAYLQKHGSFWTKPKYRVLAEPPALDVYRGIPLGRCRAMAGDLIQHAAEHGNWRYLAEHLIALRNQL